MSPAEGLHFSALVMLATLPRNGTSDCAVPDTGSATNHRPQFTTQPKQS